MIASVVPALVWAEDVKGTVKSVDVRGKRFILTMKPGDQDVLVRVAEGTTLGSVG
jgi:hypothetical protein